MKSYVFKVELTQDEDGGWTADIPALPGCASEGETADEAIANVREAAQLYIEVLIEDGRPIPTAKDGVTVVDGAAVMVAT